MSKFLQIWQTLMRSDICIDYWPDFFAQFLHQLFHFFLGKIYAQYTQIFMSPLKLECIGRFSGFRLKDFLVIRLYELKLYESKLYEMLLIHISYWKIGFKRIFKDYWCTKSNTSSLFVQIHCAIKHYRLEIWPRHTRISQF